ncbi:MAG: FixH family protein [Gallionella sp.]|nr:FixH family protein [Gallionella sp.]
MISQHNKTGFRNPWALAILALIIIVLAVNITFIWYSANDQRSALVERDYKTKDRKANDEILSELRAQQALAWKVSLNKPKALVINTPIAYEISVLDNAGKPVSGMLEVEAYRAADASKDFATAFKEVSPGNYQGYITFPLKGYWELHVRVARGEEKFGVDTDRFKVAETL